MRLKSISFLRTFAALIIINSHCINLYPISAFARGGALGNSLFFLMSGFLLYPIRLEFSEWIKKRYIRLYIPVILTGIILLILGKMERILYNLFWRFVFPEHYWFICALIVTYPIYYFIFHNSISKREYIRWSLLLSVLYVFIYCAFLDKSTYVVENFTIHGIRFSYIFSFFLMMTGGYIRSGMANIMNTLQSVREKRPLVYLLTLLSLICYFAFIILMNLRPVLLRFQFMETVFCITTTLSIFLSAVLSEDFFQSINSVWFDRFLQIGNYTLEMYLLQFIVIDYIGKFLNIFPVNIMLVYLITIPLAMGFSKLVDRITKAITG